MQQALEGEACCSQVTINVQAEAGTLSKLSLKSHVGGHHRCIMKAVSSDQHDSLQQAMRNK